MVAWWLAIPTVNREDHWLSSPVVVSKLGPFCSLCFTPVFLEETLKTVGPFYLVSMPGEVKHPQQGKYVACHALTVPDMSTTVCSMDAAFAATKTTCSCNGLSAMHV